MKEFEKESEKLSKKHIKLLVSASLLLLAS
jgi:hypothetical protein